MGQISGLVGKDIRLFLGRHAETGAHPLAGLDIPALSGGINFCLIPDFQLRLMRAAFIPSGDEFLSGIRNSLERLGGAGAILHPNRVIRRANQYKKVIHEWNALFFKAFGD